MSARDDLRAAVEHNEGLLSKYHVERRNDPEGKHNECRYFVLDPQHDPIARDALRAYATAAGAEGYFALRADLHRWLDRIEANKQLQDLEVRVAYEEAKARRAEPPSECDGSFMCDATRHEHGCYADEAGFCNHPEDHEPLSGGDCAFGGADDTNPSATRAGEVTAEELAEVIIAADNGWVYGAPADAAADAILARFDVRRRP